jgi:ubiquinone/menaquinone biosynthesis C-methylase UbiE
MSGYQLSGDAPTAYARFSYKIMEPWTDDLILSARCRDGDRVLDVACGPGLVANRVNQVSGRLCSVSGIDLNEPMLKVARANPSIEWHQGSATELPFADASFDVVLCQQGLQYFSDRPAAVREMTRVLATGGRLALNVWGALERQAFHTAILDGVNHFMGAEARALFDLAFSLHSVAELRKLAEDAGLKDIHVRLEHRTIRYPSASALAVGFLSSTPVSAQYAAMDEERRRSFIDYVVGKLATYVDDAGLAAPMENHYLAASKP